MLETKAGILVWRLGSMAGISCDACRRLDWQVAQPAWPGDVTHTICGWCGFSTLCDEELRRCAGLPAMAAGAERADTPREVGPAAAPVDDFFGRAQLLMLGSLYGVEREIVRRREQGDLPRSVEAEESPAGGDTADRALLAWLRLPPGSEAAAAAEELAQEEAGRMGAAQITGAAGAPRAGAAPAAARVSPERGVCRDSPNVADRSSGSSAVAGAVTRSSESPFGEQAPLPAHPAQLPPARLEVDDGSGCVACGDVANAACDSVGSQTTCSGGSRGTTRGSSTTLESAERNSQASRSPKSPSLSVAGSRAPSPGRGGTPRAPGHASTTASRHACSAAPAACRTAGPRTGPADDAAPRDSVRQPPATAGPYGLHANQSDHPATASGDHSCAPPALSIAAAALVRPTGAQLSSPAGNRRGRNPGRAEVAEAASREVISPARRAPTGMRGAALHSAWHTSAAQSPAGTARAGGAEADGGAAGGVVWGEGDATVGALLAAAEATLDCARAVDGGGESSVGTGAELGEGAEGRMRRRDTQHMLASLQARRRGAAGLGAPPLGGSAGESRRACASDGLVHRQHTASAGRDGVHDAPDRAPSSLQARIAAVVSGVGEQHRRATAALAALAPPPPWEVARGAADWCDVRCCLAVTPAAGCSLSQGGAFKQALVPSVRAADEEKARLRAALSLWLKLARALAEHLEAY